MKKLIGYIFGILFTANAFALNYQYAGELTNNIISPFGACFQSNHIYSSVGADSFEDSISKISMTGEILTNWGKYGANDGEFDFPACIDFDYSNRLWVADENNNRIQVFNHTGIFLFAEGSYGSSLGKFYYPTGIEIVGSNIFVAEEGNHRIQKLVFDNDFVTGVLHWGTLGTGPGEFGERSLAMKKTGIGGVTVDNAGLIYVVDGGNHRVQKFTHSGVWVDSFSSYGTNPGQLFGPTGIDFTDNNLIAVAERYNQRVQLFSTNGEFIATVGNSDYFDYPADVAAAPDKTLYITDYENDTIFIFKEGTPEFLGLPPTVIGYEQEKISFPLAGVDPNNDNLFFAISNPPAGAIISQISDTNYFEWTPGGLDSGTHKIGLFIYDDGQPNIATNFEILNFTILDTNHPPEISTTLPFSPYSIAEGQNLQFNIIMFDRDFDTLALVSNIMPHGVEITKINGTNYLFNWTPDFNAGSIIGTDYPITFWAVDSGTPNLSNSVSLTLTVIGTNNPPIIIPVPDIFISETQTAEFNVIAYDPDGDNLTFSISNAPLSSSFSQINSTNYLFQWLLGYNDAGTYSNIEFYVTDDSITPATVIEKINIIVSNQNRSATLTLPGTTFFINEGGSLNFSVQASDQDTNDMLLILASNLPTGAEFITSNSQFTWFPSYNQAGIYSNITFYLVENSITVDTKSVVIHVTNQNTPPELSGSSEIFGIENQEISFAITGTPHFGYSIGFAITNAPLWEKLQNTKFKIQKNNKNQNSTRNIQLKSERGTSKQCSSEEIPLTPFRKGGIIPTRNIQLKSERGTRKQYLSEEIPLTPFRKGGINTKFKFTDLNFFHVSNNILSISWTPSFIDAGYYTNIIIYAWEEFPDRPPETNFFPLSLIITNVNHAPQLASPENKTWYAEIPYTLQLVASDYDSDDQLTFSVVNNPADRPQRGFSIDPNTGLISWTPVQSDMGLYSNIIFTVTDNGGREEMPGGENLSTSVVFNLLIKGTNEPPIISFQKHSAIDWETAFGSVDSYEKQLIRIKVPRNDINNDNLEIEVTEMPEGAVFDTNTWILAWVPSYNQSDEAGRIFSVTVEDFGDPPQQSTDSLIIKIHDIPVQLLKDDQFYDEDWDTVSIKYKTKAGGAINIRDPKNLKITGGGEKDSLTIKAAAKNNFAIGITQKGNKNFDVENIFSDSSLKSIKLTGSLKGLNVEQLKKLIISQNVSGKIQTEKNLETIIAKNSIVEAEIIVGGSGSNSFSAAVKKIFAKSSIENSKIKIGLADSSNITNSLSVGSLNLLKTKLLLNSTIATGTPKTKSGKEKEIKIKSKETDNSTLFKTTGDSQVDKIQIQ